MNLIQCVNMFPGLKYRRKCWLHNHQDMGSHISVNSFTAVSGSEIFANDWIAFDGLCEYYPGSPDKIDVRKNDIDADISSCFRMMSKKAHLGHPDYIRDNLEKLADLFLRRSKL